MTQLDPYGSNLPSLLTPGGRALARDLARTHRDVAVALQKLDGLATYADQLADYTAQLDVKRLMLSGGSELRNELLAQELVSFAVQGMNIARSMYRRY